MKRLFSILLVLVLSLVMTAYSKDGKAADWVPEEMAGIENPGFTVIDKVENKDAITFTLVEADIDLIETFITDLQFNPDFNVNTNYNYDSHSYTFATFNAEGESIHLTYNIDTQEGTFIYAKSGSSVFTPGIRDMGYYVDVNYDYASNSDYTMYEATLSYSILPYVAFSDYNEYLVSFELTDFQIKTESTYGTLYFAENMYSGAIENYTKTGSSIYEMSFLVVQDKIGQYDVDTPYGETSTFFDVMGLNQSELDFTVAFTAYIITNVGSYTYDYEIDIMPEGSDVTEMDRQLSVEAYIETFDKAIPFTKID